MKKALMFAASLFVVFGFLMSCEKDRNNLLISPDVTFTANGRPTTMQSTEINLITSTAAFNTDHITAPRIEDYEIYELCFLGSNFINPESYYQGNYGANYPVFTVKNDAYHSAYLVKFGLRNKTTGLIWYQDISVVRQDPLVAGSSDWTFSATSVAVTKLPNKAGFNVGQNLFSNSDAQVTITIPYKGLTQTFIFALRSTKRAPVAQQ